MGELTLNIYDKAGKKIAKTYKAKTFDLMFGTVSDLMEIIKIDEITDQTELLKTTYKSWNDIKDILSSAFPDVKEDEWRRVKVKELLPAIVEIIKYSISEMLTIPADSSKN